MVEHPAMERLLRRRRVAGRRFQRRQAVVHQIVADVSARLVVRNLHLSFGGELERRLGDVALRALRPLRDALHDVAIVIARLERHPRVDARRVGAQRGLEDAAPLDERLPVEPADDAQARDAVRRHHLRQRDALVRARRGVLGVQPFLVQPRLDPRQRRDRLIGEPELAQEARHERRRERRMPDDELVQRRRDRRGVARTDDARRPPVGHSPPRPAAASCAAPCDARSRSGRAAASPAPPTARRSRGARPPGRRRSPARRSRGRCALRCARSASWRSRRRADSPRGARWRARAARRSSRAAGSRAPRARAPRRRAHCRGATRPPDRCPRRRPPPRRVGRAPSRGRAACRRAA